MTIDAILQNTPINRADAEILLGDVLGIPRTSVLAHGSTELSEEQKAMFSAYAKRRAGGEPLAYIRGRQEFYGRDFIVTPDVLIPRPATESLIDCVTRTLADGHAHEVDADTDIVCGSLLWKEVRDVATVVDVGTGSGCVAVTLACEHPGMHIMATDVSASAIAIGMRNAAKHHVADRVSFHICDLFACLSFSEPFLVVSNPPYITDDYPLDPSVKNFEPHDALFGGPDGMDIITRLASSARAHPRCVGIALECRTDQWERLKEGGMIPA